MSSDFPLYLKFPLGENANNTCVYLSHKSRDEGCVILGQTRYGKSTLLLRMIEHDIYHFTPCIVLDPHGDLINDILQGFKPPRRFLDDYIASHSNDLLFMPDIAKKAFVNEKDRAENTYLLKVDENEPFGLNLYECDNTNSLEAVQNTVDNVLNVFKRVFGEDRTYFPRIEQILRHTAYIIIQNGLTMAEIPYLFASMDFRKKCMEKVNNPQVHQFWYNYDRYRPYAKSMFLEGALNRLDHFLSSDIIYRIVSQRHTTVPFKQIFQEGGTLLVQLPTRNRELANFLGSVFLAILSQTAWSNKHFPNHNEEEYISTSMNMAGFPVRPRPRY